MAETSENLLPVQQEEPIKPEVAPTELVVRDESEFAMLFDSARFNQAQRVAKLFANSKLVPAHFQGNTAGVFVILHLATRMELDPFMVLQNTYMVHGRPGMEAKLVIALVNARGPFKGPIQWEFAGEGKNRKCTAFAYHKETGERCEIVLDWQTVEKEGWASKQGSKWLTMPDLMFRYRTAAMLARLYCPETIMGLSTVDELQDMDNVIDLEPELQVAGSLTSGPSKTEQIKDEIKRRKPRSDKGAHRKAPEPAQEAPPTKSGEDTRGENIIPPAPPQPPPRAISKEDVARIRDSLEAHNVDLDFVYSELDMEPYIPLEELDGQSAERIINYLANL